MHGASNNPLDRKIKPAIENWNVLIKISKNVLGYYFLFLYEKTLEQWHEHQKFLALGISTRFI